MSGLDYRKVAEISEKKHNFKKAADYYAGAGDLKKAYSLYEKVLSTTNDRFVISDIRKRLVELNSPKYLKDFASAANKRTLERRVYSVVSIISLIGALFFISFNVTGNSIGNLSRDDFSLFGMGLFTLGLVAFIFFKSKKK